MLSIMALILYLKDLELYESLMNGLMDRGINMIDGISFSTSKIKELGTQCFQK